MNTADFEALLKRVMGLDAASIGASAVERAVQERMTACGMSDPAAYRDKVSASETELQELIEAVVVPETWFFRDNAAFTALSRLAYEEWVRTHPEGVLRVLSFPCSTGEEPYTIAMALLDAGFAPQRFRVDALDISERALAKAKRGSYGRNSFRGTELAFRDRHFAPHDQRWQISETVHGQVHFAQGNLLDPTVAGEREPYDFVFCRNVLIYFDRPTQDRALAGLTRMMSPTGIIFVGPSETGLLLSHDFNSVRVPLAFAFRRPGVGLQEKREKKSDGTAPLRPAQKTVPVWKPAPPPPAPPPPPKKRVEAPKPAPTPVLENDLDGVVRLADQGHLAEAAKQCEAHLRERGPSAKAYYLLGLVRDAAGNHADAAGFYRKALYLEPNHPEALLHLAYLLEKQGDANGARVLNARARRVTPATKA